MTATTLFADIKVVSLCINFINTGMYFLHNTPAQMSGHLQLIICSLGIAIEIISRYLQCQHDQCRF